MLDFFLNSFFLKFIGNYFCINCKLKVYCVTTTNKMIWKLATHNVFLLLIHLHKLLKRRPQIKFFQSPFSKQRTNATTFRNNC